MSGKKCWHGYEANLHGAGKGFQDANLDIDFDERSLMSSNVLKGKMYYELRCFVSEIVKRNISS